LKGSQARRDGTAIAMERCGFLPEIAKSPGIEFREKMRPGSPGAPPLSS
jgi:hypothetical protein